MPDPASQTLLKAFLTALYTDEYITTCEEEFGFVRISGDLRQKALDEINALTITDGAPDFSFEFNTEKNTGQGDYVISVKRNSYAAIEQGDAIGDIETLRRQMADLIAANAALKTTVDALVAAGNDSGNNSGGDTGSASAAAATLELAALRSRESHSVSCLKDSAVTACLLCHKHGRLRTKSEALAPEGPPAWSPSHF